MNAAKLGSAIRKPWLPTADVELEPSWLNLCLSADRLRYSVKTIVRLDAIEAAIHSAIRGEI